MRTKYGIPFSLLIIVTIVLSACGTKDNAVDNKETITADQIKSGTTHMLATTSELKQEIEAGNESKVKELGPKLEDDWISFEEGVVASYPDLYEKVEKSLDPEIAGSQQSPIDKEILSQLNEELTQSLNELLQTIK
jgi:iron uptake system EfeUOB component EfeO/EfeM